MIAKTIDRSGLETGIGYRFTSHALLDEALTHPSAVNRKTATHYERLEFLGDRVLGLIMAEWLYEAYPDAPEGTLASYFAALVGRESLAAVAQDLDLSAYLSRAKNDAQGARGEATMLADAFEAVLAALYLDGGMGVAKALVRRLFEQAVAAQATAPRDPKSALQEWAQGQGYPVPKYVIVDRSGPSHAPIFEVEVTVKNKAPVRATGASKQEAEKAAAASLLEKIGV